MEPDRPPHTPGKDAHLCEGALQLFLAQSVTKSALDLERLWNLTSPLILQVEILVCIGCKEHAHCICTLHSPAFQSESAPKSEKINVKHAVL